VAIVNPLALRAGAGSTRGHRQGEEMFLAGVIVDGVRRDQVIIGNIIDSTCFDFLLHPGAECSDPIRRERV
jgi:hypothetical protein